MSEAYFAVDNSGSQKIYIDGLSFPTNWQWVNNKYAGGGYAQLQVWYDEYNSQYCGSMEGPVTFLGDTGNIIETLDLTGHTGISEITIFVADNNNVDGNGCQDFSGTWDSYNSLVYATDPEAIQIGLPPSSGSSTISSTTPVTMASFDLWMIYWSFFAMVCFVVWLGRSRKT